MDWAFATRIFVIQICGGMNKKQDDHISPKEIRKLARIAGRVNSVDLFTDYLLRHNYEQREKNLFVKGDTELIQLKQEDNHVVYKNHLTPGDKGGFINFLAVRMNGGVTGFSFEHYVKAAKQAERLYDKHVKRTQDAASVSMGVGKRR